MSGFSFAVAYVGGLLTLFSPCSALLIPSFFAYAFSARRALVSRTALFFLGLLAGLVPLGAALGGAGRFLSAHLWQITFWGGLVIILLGALQVFAVSPHPLAWLRARFSTAEAPATAGVKVERASALGVFLLGFTYGLAGTGCSGPIIGAISSFVLTQASAFTGSLLMAVYAAGMFTPVVLLAFLWDRAVGARRWLRPRPVRIFGRETTWGNVISGVVFIVLGAVVAFAPGARLSTSLLSPTQQANLENQVRQVLSGVPNWLFWLAAALIVAIIALAIYQRHQRPAPHLGDSEV